VTAANPEPKPIHERVCDDAIKGIDQSSRNLAASYINRGILRMRMDNYDGALEDYAAARELRPKLGAIYLNEGAARIGAGQPENAIAPLKKAVELDTQDLHAAHYNLGLAYDLTGDITNAYYAFQNALKVRPGWELAEEQLERYSVVSTG
jgi:tetratricopeptide (TPR) repeat protein